MNGRETIRLWEEALKSDDPRDANRFLWQNCQDMLETIRRQLFVIDLLNDIIYDKDAQIEELEELFALDDYGE